jgi:hypothetical protein
MLRLMMLCFVAVFGVQLPQAAEASTVTYDLTLTSSSGQSFGSGTLVVNGPLTSGSESFSSSGGGLESLNISLNSGGPASPSFSLLNAIGTTSATFQGGTLTGLSYLGDVNSFQLDLLTSGLFYLYVDFGSLLLSSAGSISAVSAAPLPPTIVLFAGGLVLLGLLAYRRKISSSMLSPAVSKTAIASI